METIEKLELEYDKVLNDYNNFIVDKFNVDDFLPYRVKGAVPGEYTDTDMAAGDTIFGEHETLIAQVPKLLENIQQAMDKNLLHPVRLSARFHCFFEYLHPFRDGNGRIGRLFANYILAQKNHPIIIVEREQKQEYIDCLKSFKNKDANTTDYIEMFFLKTAIGRMNNEIKEKKNLSRNFMRGYDVYDSKD